VTNRNLLKRWGHGATALSVSSECVEVLMFGGKENVIEDPTADSIVLRFGKLCENVYIPIMTQKSGYTAIIFIIGAHINQYPLFTFNH